ncbi:MAG: hypothetical protein ACK4S0_12100, partial [Sediminibacterium sp.]
FLDSTAAVGHLGDLRRFFSPYSIEYLYKMYTIIFDMPFLTPYPTINAITNPQAKPKTAPYNWLTYKFTNAPAKPPSNMTNNKVITKMPSSRKMLL